VWLARETKRALERSDYLALHKAELTTLDALVSSDEQALMRIVSSMVEGSGRLPRRGNPAHLRMTASGVTSSQPVRGAGKRIRLGSGLN